MTRVIHTSNRAIDRRLTGQLVTSSSELEVHKIEYWAQHDGLLLLSETVFKLLLRDALSTRDSELEDEDDEEEENEDDMAANNTAVKYRAKKGKKSLSPEAQRTCERLLLDPFLILIDEAHRIQNPRSQMTQVYG